MTVQQMITAHGAFGELLALRLPYGRVRSLRRLAAWLEEEMDTYCAEERKAADQCGAAVGDNGSLHFPSDAAKEEYIGRIREIRETPVDGWPAVTLTEEDLEGQKLTLQAMMDLEGFVDFGGDEDGAV